MRERGLQAGQATVRAVLGPTLVSDLDMTLELKHVAFVVLANSLDTMPVGYKVTHCRYS
jgi:hypothetical protein